MTTTTAFVRDTTDGGLTQRTPSGLSDPQRSCHDSNTHPLLPKNGCGICAGLLLVAPVNRFSTLRIPRPSPSKPI